MKYVCYWCHGRGWMLEGDEWGDKKVPCEKCVGRGQPSFLQVALQPAQQIIEAEFTIIEVKKDVVEEKAPDAGAADTQGGDAQGTGSLPVDGPALP